MRGKTVAGAAEAGSGSGSGWGTWAAATWKRRAKPESGEGLQPRPLRPPCFKVPAERRPPRWKGEDTGSGTGQGIGSLLGWEDLPNLKGVRAGGGLAPGSLLKQLVRCLPLYTYLALWCPVRAPRCTGAARGGEHLN